MTSFCTTFFIIILYSSLFLFTGTFVIEKLSLLNRNKFHKFFILGSGFFIGYGLFLSFWCILDYTFRSAKLGLFLSTLTVIITSFLFLLEKRKFITLNRKQSFLIFLLFLILIGFGTFRALTPMPSYFVTNPELVNPFLGFGGVGHSFRAGNISEYIVTNDNIPLINQHSGQSILATIPMFLANQSAQLSLVLWLNIFIGFFIITIYGFSRYFFSSSIYSLIPVLLVFLGNTVLSPFYTSITDTESALLLSTNVDNIFGIASFFILLILIYLSINKEISLKSLTYVLILFGFIWNITSGQMILLLPLSLVISFFILMNENKTPNVLILPAIYLVLAAIIGSITLGGMLSPIKSNALIPGLMTLKNDNEPVVSLRFPRTGEGYSQSILQFRELYLAMKQPKETIPVTETNITTSDSTLQSEVKNDSLILNVAKLVRSTQLVFFPVLGIFLTMYLLFKSKVLINSKLLRFLIINACLLFFAGWITSSVFKLYGYYWELSKFLSIGSLLGMLMLGISLSLTIADTKSSKIRIAATLLLCFITLGPISEYFLTRTLGNIYLKPESSVSFSNSTLEKETKLSPLKLTDRFNILNTTHDIYGENLD